MKNDSIKKINVAGTIGYIVCILLIIASIAGMVITAIGTAGAISVSKETVGINIGTEIDISSGGDILGKLNKFIKVDGVDDFRDLLKENGGTFRPDDKDVSEITVKEKDNGLSINARLGDKEFTMTRVIVNLIFTFLYLGAITVALEMLKSLMKELKKCETPFTEGVIKKMTFFAVSLIPAAVLHIINSSLWSSLGSDSRFSMSINLSVVLLVAVIFILVSVFKYGADLQKESDETL